MGFEIAANMLAGIGIFLIAFKYFSSYMQELVSYEVRTVIKKFTPNVAASSFWGFLMGFLLQDVIVVACIMISLINVGALTLRKSIFMLAASNIGATFFLYVIFINFEVAILYLLGISGIAFSLERPFKWRYYLGSVFCICLMLFAVQLIGSQSANLAALGLDNWVTTHLHGEGYLAAFVIGCILLIVSQSDFPWLIIGANLLQNGVINFETMMMLIFGMHLGIGISAIVLAWSVKGVSRQIFNLDAAFNCFLGLAFLAIFYLELYFGTSYLKELAIGTSDRLEWQVVNLVVIVNCLTAALFMIYANPMAAFLSKHCQTSDVEFPTRPRFLDKAVISDPESAAELIHKDITALIQSLPPYINERNIEGLVVHRIPPILYRRHESYVSIVKAGENIIFEMTNKHFSSTASVRLLRAMDEFHEAKLLERPVFELSTLVLPDGCSERTQALFGSILESEHALLSVLVDTLQSNTPEDWKIIHSLTKVDGSLFEEIRNTVIAKEVNCSEEEKMLIFTMTRLIQQVIWIIHEIEELHSMEPEDDYVNDL